MRDQEAAAAWETISAAWVRYCTEGTKAFDWDEDSRKVMAALTGHQAFEWMADTTADPFA